MNILACSGTSIGVSLAASSGVSRRVRHSDKRWSGSIGVARDDDAADCPKVAPSEAPPSSDPELLITFNSAPSFTLLSFESCHQSISTMSPSKLGVFANLALAASAVLIPSTMNLDEGHALEAFAVNPLQRSVALECPGCALATLDGDSLKWKEGAGNTFRLDFDVGPQDEALNLDSAQIFPPSVGIAFATYHLTQMDPSSDDGLRLRITGFEFDFNGAETISEEGTELLPMTLKITSVEDMPMDPPVLQINMLKNAEGRLMIASFNKAEPSRAGPSEQECNRWPMYCKWKGIMADRLEQLKHMGKPKPGCHMRMRPHNPMEHETIEGKPPHRFHPGKPHGEDQHHHAHHHRIAMFARRAFFTIFVPILIGVFAGTLTYLVGMALGCLIAMTVAKFRGQRYQAIALREEDVEDFEDGDVEEGLKMGEQDEKEEFAELPAYDAPPVYDEAADKTVNETK